MPEGQLSLRPEKSTEQKGLEQLYKLIEDKLRISRSAACFRMELRREERLRLMPDSFVRPVVHIDKERFPVSPQRIIIHRIAVILARNIDAAGFHIFNRLVRAAVAVMQFFGFRSL